MKTLRSGIADNGVLVITIRPVEFWHLLNGWKMDAKLIAQHAERGFAFRPHNRTPIGGDVTYGDTSMTPDYMRENFKDWRIAGVDWNMSDGYQVFVSLQPA